MKATGAFGLYGIAALLRFVSWPILILGGIAVVVAGPILTLRDACLAKAREWDPRLAARGGTTDYQPPAGSPPR